MSILPGWGFILFQDESSPPPPPPPPTESLAVPTPTSGNIGSQGPSTTVAYSFGIDSRATTVDVSHNMPIPGQVSVSYTPGSTTASVTVQTPSTGGFTLQLSVTAAATGYNPGSNFVTVTVTA